MKFSSTAAVVAFLALGSTTAYAQDAIVKGSGYQVSERTVVHPSVGAQTGYVSNVFYDEDSSVPSGIMRILATLALEPMEDLSGKGGSPADIDFSAGLRLEYQEFLSGNDSARAQRNLGIGADLLLDIKPSSQFPISLEDHFLRTNRPTNFESRTTLARDINSAKVRVGYQPEGRNISGRISYQNTVDVFESDGSSFANRMLNTFQAGVDWQFLPITRFYVQASYGINGGLGGSSTKVGSAPIRGIAGVATALTERLTLRAHGGYAYGPYSSGQSFSGIVGGLEGGFRYSPVGRLRLLYRKEFRDSINANYFSEHMFKAIVDQQIERVMLTGDVAARLRTYGGVSLDFGAGPTRDDFILSSSIKASYLLRDWISLSASYDLALVQTDFVSMIEAEPDDPSYVRHQIMAGATAAF